MRASTPSQPPASSAQSVPRGGGRKWWSVALLAVVGGSVIGVGIARVTIRATPQSSSQNQIITSTGGVFARGRPYAAPSWSLPSLRDPRKTVSLTTFANRPLVLNFWASWCAPCRKEMPALEATARSLGAKVAFVGIDTNDARNSALAFVAKTGVRYPVAFDPHASVADTYGVYGLPTTFFISANGDVVGRQVGGLTETRLRQLIGQTFPAGSPARKTNPG